MESLRLRSVEPSKGVRVLPVVGAAPDIERKGLDRPGPFDRINTPGPSNVVFGSSGTSADRPIRKAEWMSPCRYDTATAMTV
jgi:hypothetical protein